MRPLAAGLDLADDINLKEGDVLEPKFLYVTSFSRNFLAPSLLYHLHVLGYTPPVLGQCLVIIYFFKEKVSSTVFVLFTYGW